MAGIKSAFIFFSAAVLIVLLGGPALAQWGTDARIDTDTNGNTKANSFVARSGNNVYACWKDYRIDYNNGVIIANYSHDGGQTWGSQDQRVDTGKVGGSSISNYPAIACSGDYVYVAWQDYRNDPGNADLANIYFNRSTNGGLSWEATDQRIDLGAPANDVKAKNVDIAADGAEVYIVWEDYRSGISLPNAYFSMSDSYGAAGTWTTPVCVDDYSGQFYKQAYPVMANVGNRIYIAWQDSRDADANVYMNHSFNGGRTWDSNDVRRVCTDYPAPGDSIYIDIAATGSSGSGGGSGPFKTVRRKSGLSFSVTGPYGSTNPSPRPNTASKDRVYCFWRDYRNTQGPYMLDVYFNFSHDGGLTWGSRDQRINTNHSTPGTYWVGYPTLAASGKGIYLVWIDEKDDTSPGTEPFIDDVYVNVSLLGGVVGTWSGPTRLDAGTAPGTVDCWHPQATASWPYVAVTWMDERDDQVNFYDAVYCAHSTTAGYSWSADERVDSGGSSLGAKYAEMHLAGNVLDVIYYDYRNAQRGVFYNSRSL